MQPNETIKNNEQTISPEDMQAYTELSDTYKKVFGQEPDLKVLDALSEDMQDQIIDKLLEAEQ